VSGLNLEASLFVDISLTILPVDPADWALSLKPVKVLLNIFLE